METGNQSVGDSALVKTEFYNDFFKPNDWLHVATGIIDVAKAQAEFRTIFAIRSPSENPFGADELDIVRYLNPHLRRAAAISHRMADLQGRVDQIVSGELDMKTLAALSLTPTEAHIAIALFKGNTAEKYAKERGVSINTVRWHIKRIYEKTGVRRHSELLLLLRRKTLL